MLSKNIHFMIDSNIFELLMQKTALVAENIKKMQSSDLEVTYKKDNTIVTNADYTSHRQIIKILNELAPNIPIISEENNNIPNFNIRKNWQTLWLVDPLDGTKSYYQKNKEFAINIALIHNNKPVFGLIYAAALDCYYYAIKDKGAYKVEKNGKKNKLQVSKKPAIAKVLIGFSTKVSPQLKNILDKKLNTYEISNIASALKFAFIAEGSYHFYPNLGICYEWDTAAGVCLINEAGGTVTNIDTNDCLYYNCHNLKSPHFYVSSI